MSNHLERHVTDLREVLRQLPLAGVAGIADMLFDAYRRDATIFICGNGGSAATASHFACDLAKNTRQDALPRFRAVALTDNIPLLTAWANDSDYSRVFAEQIAPLVRPGDVLLVISASGNSPNVLAAADSARGAGAMTAAITGPTGGRIASLVDLTVCVPAATVEQVEDAHSAITHALTIELRERLRAESPPPARESGASL